MRRHGIWLTAALVVSACRGEDARTAWDDVVKRCSVSDFNGPRLLYFGPSNVIGPGATFRRDDDGIFRPRYDVAHMNIPRGTILNGQTLQCNGTSSDKFGLDAAASFSVPMISADTAVALSRAQSVDVRASGVKWDEILEGPYESYVRGLPANNPIRADLERGNRFVLSRALRVSGFKVVMQFSASDAGNLKGKYHGILPGNLTGNVGGSLRASWSADNKLTLETTGDFYIAGEMREWNAGTLASADASHLAPVANISASVNRAGPP